MDKIVDWVEAEVTCPAQTARSYYFFCLFFKINLKIFSLIFFSFFLFVFVICSKYLYED